MAGRVDGTAAIVEDRGIVFLFNPNPGRKEARFKLDATIGLVKGGTFMIKELYPGGGPARRLGRGALDPRRRGRPDPAPAARPPSSRSSRRPARSPSPSCSTSAGAASLECEPPRPDRRHRRRRAPCVRSSSCSPAKARVRALSVNGVGPTPSRPTPAGSRRPSASPGGPSAAPRASARSRPASRAERYKARITVPARVFTQLAERKKAWPVDVHRGRPARPLARVRGGSSSTSPSSKGRTPWP
ncbi:MAG: hypothetical protein M0C28_25270 [Candidatus Moduliflexus flocculans]|nr:hypothetical protein [Candidatus Moduliflexus flocculans]